MMFASEEAAQLVRQMPAAERPNSVDALDFHDFFVVAHLCERTTAILMNTIDELEKGDHTLLQNLRGFEEVRRKNH
jgi:hypothetical protein